MSCSAKTKVLNDDTQIPLLAFGTGSSSRISTYILRISATVHNGRDSTPEILRALQNGFRHIETSRMYENEAYIRSAIDQWEGGAREDLFIQSNWGCCKLGTDYIDLYLIHGPNLMQPLRLSEAWAKMEEFHARGLVKSIGLSCFPAEEIMELSKIWKVVPSVNQVEYHPYCFDLPLTLEMMSACEKYDIAVEPFTSLAALTRWPGGPAASAALRIAGPRGISTAQALLAWARQMTGGPIVTTCRKEHQYREILDSLEITLTADEIEIISAAGREAPQKRRYALEVWQDAGNGGCVR